MLGDLSEPVKYRADYINRVKKGNRFIKFILLGVDKDL